jgi:transcriptional/translational regulatory protein YebC/TACO1
METDAEDIKMEAGYIKILTALEDFITVEKFFEEKNIELQESKIDYIPDTEVEVDDFDKALKVKKMIETLNEDEDVNTVSSNEIISDELNKEVDEFIEKNTFRS